MVDSIQTSTLLLRAMIHSAKRRGLTASSFRRGLGVPLGYLEHSTRVATPFARSAAQELSSLVGDSALGLHAAEEAPVGAFGVIEDLVQNSRTWGEGLARLARYFSLVDESASLRIVTEGNEVHVFCQARDMVPVAEDLFFASLALRARQYSGLELRPLYARSAFSRPAELHERERILDTPMYYDSQCAELVFEREACEARHPSAEPAVAYLLESIVQRSESASRESAAVGGARQATLLHEANIAVRFCLEQGSVQVRDVAAVMGTSARSLQRHLRSAGTSVRELVERQRSEFLANHGGRISKAAAASCLGYSDRRSLRRARLTWKGGAQGSSDAGLDEPLSEPSASELSLEPALGKLRQEL